MRYKTLTAFALGSFVVCGLAMTANATSYHGDYGTFTGSSVVFNGVTEDTSSSSSALFGAPVISGDSLTFNPLSFGAYAINGASTTMDSTLNMTITSVGLNVIDRILLTEPGDYSLYGSRGTSQTNASIAAPLLFEITQVDGQPISPIVLSSDNMDFTPFGGTYALPGNKASGMPWDGSVILDVTGVLRANGYAGYATEVDLTWESDLTANSQSGTISYIKMKEAGGTGVTILPPDNTVPEPVTFIGVLVGLTGLATYIRRRTRVGV